MLEHELHVGRPERGAQAVIGKSLFVAMGPQAMKGVAPCELADSAASRGSFVALATAASAAMSDLTGAKALSSRAPLRSESGVGSRRLAPTQRARRTGVANSDRNEIKTCACIHAMRASAGSRSK